MGDGGRGQDAVAPRVRLVRMNGRHVRVAELLRVLRNNRGIYRLDTTDVALELARRGVLDPLGHFLRSDGAVRVTVQGAALVREALLFCKDAGLVEPYRPGYRGYRSVYELTQDGRATLDDWDDPTADGIYWTSV